MPQRNETKSKKRPVEQYDHKGKKRLNNPPVGLVDASTDAIESRKTYAYDPHLDPQLVWAGKAERTSFETSIVSLHVHERIDPRGIVEAVRKKNGSNYEQLSLFAARGENPPLREAIAFYKHAHNWSNRLIAGDSLLVMNSLIEKEGMAGQVQMVYIDPPYGIKYGSNFQPFVNKRDVEGRQEPWARGVSGNPTGMKPGTRHRATRMAEKLMAGDAEAVVNAAKGGDMTAADHFSDRVPSERCPHGRRT